MIKARLDLVLSLIGLGCNATFLDQSQSKVKQSQCDYELRLKITQKLLYGCGIIY